ncbi:putative aminopeptidase npepl1, partial [Quaeritorhiza haematococci]
TGNVNGNGSATSTLTTYAATATGTLTQLTFATIPTERTRLNAIIRTDSIQDVVAKQLPKSAVDVNVVICLKTKEEAFAAGCAVAKAIPLYSRKTGKEVDVNRTVRVVFVLQEGSTEGINYNEIQLAANGIRLAARLTDMPTSELNTDTYLDEVKAVLRRLEPFGVTMKVIRGEELKEKGFGGLYGVGMAADHPPALAILSYTPPGATKTLAWVGKGIVYDTGGLSIKGKDHMPNMKCDMAGSAAVLAAFEAWVLSRQHQQPDTKVKSPLNVHALLCLAENAVDSRSQRPDDILHMYSGKTVEINNTDAEGRLVLADGLAYATKHLSPDVILDIATLTGAQSYATGKIHAGVLANSEFLERTVVAAGKKSGDLVFPLIYAPEFLGIPKQFASEVADMKNSVKDRANASSSCAGHFLEEHLVGD